MIQGPLGVWKFPILNSLITRVVSTTSQAESNDDPSEEEVKEAEEDDRVVVVREVEQVPVSMEEEDSGIEFPMKEGQEQKDRGIPIEDETSDETLFIEQKDVELTSRVNFEPSTEDIEGNRIASPVEGEGTLKAFLVVVDSPDFEVFAEIDDSDIVRESFSELSTVSNELESISAYQDGDKHVVAIRGYPFQEFASAGIKPTSVPITVERIRMEIET